MSELTKKTLSLLILLCCFYHSAFATDFVVDNAGDNLTVDGNITLREAIQAANTNAAVGDAPAGSSSGDKIVFDSTVFTATNNVIITLADVAGLGDYEITDDLVIDGFVGSGGGPTSVTISGNDLNRIFSIRSGSSNPTVIRGLILRNGDGTDNPADSDFQGGAIFVTNSTNVTINNSFVFSSQATIGGGIFTVGGDLTLNSTIVGGGPASSNDATGASADHGGGGIFTSTGNITLNDSLVSYNTASGTAGSGGGIFMNGGNLTVNRGTIFNNSSNRAGGGIETRSTLQAVTVNLNEVTVAGNTTGNVPGNGGGLHVTAPLGSNPTTINVNSGTFFNNIANQEGGGLWNDVSGTLTINDTSISSNTANAANNTADQGGGGIFNNGGIVNISQATITNNHATSGTSASGGGILNDGGTLSVTGGFINGNSAIRAGGGIEATTANNRDSSVNLTSVVISGNIAGNAPGNGGGIHITDVAGGPSSNFTIDGGSIAGNTANQEGGGLWNDAGSTLTIAGTNITANLAKAANDSLDAQGGGGIFNNGGTVNIRDASVSLNAVSGSITAVNFDDGGGGIFNDGRNNPGATVTITNSVISNNTASQLRHSGGGLMNFGGINLSTGIQLNSSTVSGNYAAQSGGGIENTQGQVTIQSSKIDSNRSSNSGGGYGAFFGGALIVNDSTISNNSTQVIGGGLANGNGGNSIMTIDQSTVSNNSARFGGGISNFNAATLNISSSTISGNSATFRGGGLDNLNGILNISNSTIASNIADSDNDGTGQGGGINTVGTASVSINSSIIADNIDNTGAAPDILALSPFAANFTIIKDVTGFPGGIIGSNGNTSANPLLGPLADNGGPTLTHALLSGSPAIDGGSNTFCPNVDQRGFARPVDGLQNGALICDNGAFEFTFDCNNNNIADSLDIQNSNSQDCDGNFIPDECQVDGDGDGTIDSCDQCPNDNAKTVPGTCGCGAKENVSTASIGVDCNANNLADQCEVDGDIDGVIDSCDQCPQDSNKIEPGVCGCNALDLDLNNNGVIDCLIAQDLQAQLALLRAELKKLKKLKANAGKNAKAANKQQRQVVLNVLNLVLGIVNNSATSINVSGKQSLDKLSKGLNKAVVRATRTKSPVFGRNKRRASRKAAKFAKVVS